MNRLVLSVVTVTAALLTACGGTEIVVQAQVEGVEEGQMTAVPNMAVRAIPYDRDAIFDSLRAEYAEPEPEVPQDLRLLQDSISQAQAAWRNAESRWSLGRDSLRALRTRMDGLSPASGQYIALFNQFNALEGQVRTAEQQMNQAFQRFQNLQNRYTERAQNVRLERERWADAAYADIDRVITTRLRELRREEAADTTDGNGRARIRVRPGQWWVHARFDLPFEELYWNLPVTVTRGESVEVELTRGTAEVRPKL